jgi:serine/threonine protein kinase
MPILTSGEKLGRYIILEKRGQGHYGEVWKAKHEETEMPVAIKVLHGEFAKKESLEILRNEAWILGKLRHKNIVRCLDFSTRYRYLALDFVDGYSLEEILVQFARERKWIKLDTAKQIVKHSLEALVNAHSQSVVHGDIKPGNIMIPKTGETMLTDWGVARILGTVGSRIKGSSTFASPEVLIRWDAGENWSGDYQSDLFSIGAVAYLLLSGKHPFLHQSSLLPISETIKRADYEPPVLECTGDSEIPQKCVDVVMRLLDKDPSKRYQSARDALKDWLGEDVIQCPQCGSENTKDANFCNSCGASMKGEITPGNTALEMAYNKSLILFRSNPDQAIEILKTALNKHDKFPRAWSHLAYMYNSVRLYSEAIEACNHAIKIDAKLPEPYQTRGFAKSNLGMYNEAIADFTDALELVNPEDNKRKAQILAFRGYTYMLAGNDKNACEDATLALRLDPTNQRASWLVKMVCK